jgi:hypothetical protein
VSYSRGGSSYPTLTKENYSDRALLMKVKLKARGLWKVVNSGGKDTQEDMMALDVLGVRCRQKWWRLW